MYSNNFIIVMILLLIMLTIIYPNVKIYLILLILVLIASYAIMDDIKINKNMEHLSTKSNEAIQNISSLSNDKDLNITNINVTGKLICNGNTKTKTFTYPHLSNAGLAIINVNNLNATGLTDINKSLAGKLEKI
jgi:DNA replication protein DnaD